MKRLLYFALALTLVSFGLPSRIFAQQQQDQDQQGRPERPGHPGAHEDEALNPNGCSPSDIEEKMSVTQHTIREDGETIPYTATAGLILLKNDKGEPTGLMYSVAYTRNDVKDLSTRPISFLYNGGPGSATLWLHMGAYGPRRIVTTNAPDFTPPAPFQIVDNTESLLDKSDLVFIDAMGTGYSHAVCKGKPQDFYGIDEDIDAFGQFIDTYISRNNRWNSPKFLIGESYGTFRSAALGNYLQERYSMQLNGIVLMSSVLDLSQITFGPGDDRPYEFYLPSYAAVAWYHNMLKNKPSDLPGFIQQAREYAYGDYAAALAKGSSISDQEKSAVAAKLSSFTGLSEDYLIKADLRVKLGQFMAELERREGKTVGRIDARFTGDTLDLLEENAEGDPEGPAVGGAFTAAVNEYTNNELKFGKGMVYNDSIVNGRSWNWKRRPNPFQRGGFFPGAPNVEQDLAHAMVTNPYLHVQVENGYFDFATPFFATEYTMDHLGLPPNLEKNISLKYYMAGHMMYLHTPDRVLLHNNVAAFIEANIHPQSGDTMNR
jgi:carboxypeptidase C (cathepsin A)